MTTKNYRPGRPAVRDLEALGALRELFQRAHPGLSEGTLRLRADQVERFLRLHVPPTVEALRAFAASLTSPQRAHFRAGWGTYARSYGYPEVPPSSPVSNPAQLGDAFVGLSCLAPSSTIYLSWGDVILAGEARRAASIRDAPTWHWWAAGRHYVVRYNDGVLSRGLSLEEESHLARLAVRSLGWAEAQASVRVPHHATEFGLPSALEAARAQQPNAAIFAPFPGAPVGMTAAVLRKLVAERA